MEMFAKLVYRSVNLSSRQPRWWLLALLQAMAFSAIGQLARLRMLNQLSALWLALAIGILPMLTIWLWQDVEKLSVKDNQPKAKNNFYAQSVSGIGLIIITVFIILLTRLIFPFWPLHTLIFAVATSTAGLALLYVALCGQNLSSAFALAIDTWNKRLSFAAFAAIVLIIAHGMSFALVHGVFENVYLTWEFSVFGHSATIWLLLTALLLLIAYFWAILNCFVVLLFLETINRKKDPEAIKQEVSKLETSVATI